MKNKNIGKLFKKVVGGAKNWAKEGMPLPGAKKPPKGKRYLRGRLIKK